MVHYMAVDLRNGGAPIALFTKHPRKELMEMVGRKRAAPMYCDMQDGKTVFEGWVIGPCWFKVFKVTGIDRPRA